MHVDPPALDPWLLRTIQALAEESCIQSALYASISRNSRGSKPPILQGPDPACRVLYD